MKSERRTELLQRGWREQELKHAEEVLERAKQHDVFFSKIVFWSALLVIIFGNVVVALILIPFLIVLNNLVLYATVAILALIIGFLYNFLITDIGHLEKKHHRIASVIIPVLALANMVVVVVVSNRFIQDLKVDNPVHNVWIVAAVFVVAFVVPYVVNQIRLMITNRSVGSVS